MQQPAQPASPASPSPQTLREQISETVREQVEAARAMAQDAAGAAQAAAAQDAAPGDLAPSVVVNPQMPLDLIPPQVVDIVLIFFITIFAIIVGFPIARALARWIDRRGQQPRVPADLSNQLSQIAQSVDAMAIEIERISEGQRFTTRLLADQQARHGAIASGDRPPS